jgi:hypothetical protein
MRTIIVILALIVTVSCYAQKNKYIDGRAIKFLTGVMFYEKEADTSGMAPGFFIGAEFEQPLNSGPFVMFFVPELNYWAVENRKNIAFGLLFRGKFKAGSSVRPYLDAGLNFNSLSRGGVSTTFIGASAGGGIDFTISNSNIAVVIDIKARGFFAESTLKTGFSLTPGIRIGF